MKIKEIAIETIKALPNDVTLETRLILREYRKGITP
ncbi:MAG: hypothetical protein HW390_749 [Candidatus Brocadiaceae bacterium]|nr:hypothetical protein [Candidatus Brocadiaceae bacterium]